MVCRRSMPSILLYVRHSPVVDDRPYFVDFSLSIRYLGKAFWGLDPQIKGLLEPILAQRSVSKGFGVIAILGLLWSASKLQTSIIRVNKYAFNLESYNYVYTRSWAIVSSILIVFGTALSLVVLVFGQKLLDLLEFYMMRVFRRNLHLNDFLVNFRWLFGLVLFVLLNTLMYFTSMEGQISAKKLLPGSIFSALGTMIATVFYSIYIGRQNSYDLLYGSMASVIMLLFWFWILGYVIMLGTLVNKSFIVCEADEKRIVQEKKARLRKKEFEENKIEKARYLGKPYK